MPVCDTATDASQRADYGVRLGAPVETLPAGDAANPFTASGGALGIIRQKVSYHTDSSHLARCAIESGQFDQISIEGARELFVKGLILACGPCAITRARAARPPDAATCSCARAILLCHPAV